MDFLIDMLQIGCKWFICKYLSFWL